MAFIQSGSDILAFSSKKLSKSEKIKYKIRNNIKFRLNAENNLNTGK